MCWYLGFEGLFSNNISNNLKMRVGALLTNFYRKNGIPENGGFDKDHFEMKVFGMNLTLPNPQFRKETIHIHDIQHILNDCDTSWKGEGFISGWEMSTGMWKHFPIGLLSLWAMGYSLWIYPSAVLSGFKKGLNDKGIIDLEISKSEFLKMEFSELKRLTKKDTITKMGIWQWTQFFFWSLISQVVLLSPLIVLIIGILLLK